MTGPRIRRQGPVSILASLLIAACGGDGGGPSGPAPVATVQVTANTTSIRVGETVQLVVTLLDANGNALSGRTIAYTTSSAGIATVTPAGLVTGVAAGNATITAAAEGRSGTIGLTVTSAGTVSVTSITPATLRPGEAATLTGTGFATLAANNTVTIGGELATVTSSTATTIQITVPSSLCQPSGNAAVRVTVGSQQSSPLNHPVQNDAAPLQIPVGQLTLLETPASLCLRFAASAADEAFAFGIQSFNASSGSLTPVRVTSSGFTSSPPEGMDPSAQVRGGFGLTPGEPLSPREWRWLRHREAETRLRSAERPFQSAALSAMKSLQRSPEALAAAQSAATIPANVAVGDTVVVRVPNIDSPCTQFTEIRTVVRHIGQRGVWLDDVGNPANGLTLADFQSLSQTFDSRIYAVDTDWFGQPTDMDQNSRVVIVTTKEVNKLNDILGFVASADLVPRTGGPVTCQSSDFGEIYYGRAADPTGQFGEMYTVTEARNDAVILIAHEFTHIIQFGRRLTNPQAQNFQSPWELEGQATLAEEVNGHAAANRSAGQNYGFDVAWSGASQNALPSDIAWYVAGFVDLAIYYGLNITQAGQLFRTQNAPEQCTWVGRQRDGNTGPCLSGREVYGTSWMFLRWLTDHFAATTQGGAQGFHRALINDNETGFTTIAKVTNSSVNLLLAQWAAALWLDDRHQGMQARLTMPSWNLFNIIDQRLVSEAHLVPRTRTFAGAFSDNISVRGGSTGYYTISGANRPASYIRFRRTDGGLLPAGLQVWVVRTR